MSTSQYRPAHSGKFMIENKNGYEVSVKWKIEKFSVASAKADYIIKSPKFHCADAVWSLLVYPNGQRAFGNVGNVLMFLSKIRSPTFEHSTAFKFDVIDERGNEIYDMLPLRIKCRGNSRKWMFCMIKREDILEKSSGILSQDTLTVSFYLNVIRKDIPFATSTEKAKLKDEEMPTKCPHCLKPVVGDFESLYNNPRFSDVTLKLGQSKFPAHKVVLGSRSKVFEAMFEHDMKENRNSTVDLIEMEISTVTAMLRYMYCRDTRQLTPHDAIDLYAAADRYDLQELVTICRKIILENVSMNNVCDIAVIADLHDDKELNDAVQVFLFKNIKELLKMEEWKTFSKEKSDLSVKLLESVILSEKSF